MFKAINSHQKTLPKKRGSARSSHILDLKEAMIERERERNEQKVSRINKIMRSASESASKLSNAREVVFNSGKQSASVLGSAINKIKLSLKSKKSQFKPNYPAVPINKNKKNLQELPVEFQSEKVENKKTEIKKPKQQKQQVIKSNTISCGPVCPFRLKYSATNILLFLFFVSIFILPIKGMAYIKSLKDKASGIIGYATAGASNLQEIKTAGLNNDLDAIFSNFNSAQENFTLASEEVGQINKIVQLLIKNVPQVGDSFVSGEKIIVLGKNIASAGEILTDSFSVFSSDQKDLSPAVKLTEIKNKFILALADLNNANQVASEIQISAVPQQYQDNIKKVQEMLPVTTAQLKKIIYYIGLVEKIIGQDQLKRYLLVFQNNNEIRASGGFVGSYALLDINQGKIENLEVPAGGSYDLQAGETENIVSPHPLWLINPHWHFWDANWFFDFPTSAEKLMKFYNSSGGPTVDGVIAINATLMQELVASFGPIKIDGYDYEITGDNFIKILQEESYNHKDEATPKKFLSLMAPIILEKITNDPRAWLNILPILQKGLQQKDLQFYFSAYDLQKEIMDSGWSGRVLETDKDYLAVVHSNLTGGKTDQMIKSEIWHQTEILASGEVEDTLIITRTHQGEKGDVFTGQDNNDYMRIYTPLGSELISARGFSALPLSEFQAPADGYHYDELIKKIEDNTHVDEQSGTEVFTESNKTVFANWLQLSPGDTKSVYLKYRLPFVVKKSQLKQDTSRLKEYFSLILNPGLKILASDQQLDFYSLLMQKQSGYNNLNFIKTIKMPVNYRKGWSYPRDWQESEGSYKVSGVLNSDIMQVVIVE